MAKNENEIKIKVIEQTFEQKQHKNGKSEKLEKLKEHRFAGKFLDYSAKEKLK